MKYSEKLPKIAYQLRDGGEFFILTDITKNVRFIKSVIKNLNLLDDYNIIDGDTPEKISEKLYGTPDHHWVIIILNEMENWVEEFPLSYSELQEHINRKYKFAPGVGTTYIDGVAYARATTSHYENRDGIIVFYDPSMGELGANWALETIENDPFNEEPRRITVYDVEERLNEDKRRIKVLSQSQLNEILEMYKRI